MFVRNYLRKLTCHWESYMSQKCVNSMTNKDFAQILLQMEQGN